MYLFVFDKSARQRKVILFNHDLADPERFELRLRKEKPIDRLDFGYHRSGQLLERLMQDERLGWQRLGDIAMVLRGDVSSPLGPACAVPTSDFANGFWKRAPRHKLPQAFNPDRTIQRGDLLVKRVGRDCHKSFGRPLSLLGMPCSDCVLIVRPKNPRISTQLLFALQSLFETHWSGPLVERGTGASYVSLNSLLTLSIPTKLHERCPKTYASYALAQNRRVSGRSNRATRFAARQLDRIGEV
jgi:hypothetical protein